MSKIAEQIEKFIEPIVTELGYEIVEVEFAKKHNGDNLTVFIDKKKIFIGKLLSFDETSIELETHDGNIKLERKMISKATKYIEF